MKEKEEVCLLGSRVLNDWWRLLRLVNVEEVLTNTYIHFFNQVDQPYSCEEQEALTRITTLFVSLLQGEVLESCSFCKFSKDDVTFWGHQEFFRLDLPSKNPFSTHSRLCCLKELETKLNCFFINETGNKPYSWEEKKVLRRMKKIFVHELRNTPKYDLFKTRHVHRVSEEDQLELKYQQTDEIRLRHVPICRYNPLSQKFKKIKEEYLKKIETECGKL